MVEALDNFQMSVENDLLPQMKKEIRLPFEIEKIVIDRNTENQKLQICRLALQNIAEWQEYPVRAEYLAELLLVNVQRVYLVVIYDRTKSRT